MSESPGRFRILGVITDVEVIAEGSTVRIRRFLTDTYGGRRWRKMKGVAVVESENGWIGNAEIHWFESHGIGKVRWKLKRKLER